MSGLLALSEEFNPPDRIMNRNPARRSTQYSRSQANAGGPQVLIGALESGQDWTPYGTRPTHPFRKGMPYSLMSVEQATGFYNSAVGMWPANGQADYPNGQQTHPHMNLPYESSAHAGFTMPTGVNPNMVFVQPPVFGFQTRPLYATGL